MSEAKIYTAREFAALLEQARLDERERCARICESKQDWTEEADAHVRARQSENESKSVGEQLSRFKHLQTVSLWNSALSQSAAAIRAQPKE